ncbi:hypothetical protein K1719_040894 [Acacia pycnantha]|nr:hypothetical protein K1719_040894 [Acacia pycnantha]
MRVRSLICLNDPLPTGFWIPREDLEHAWVSVKYERLQVFCYKCGRIGHNGNACRFPNHYQQSEEGGGEFGKWLSVPAVKTIEENVVVWKKDWVEAALMNPSAPASPPRRSFSPKRTLASLVNRYHGGMGARRLVGTIRC